MRADAGVEATAKRPRLRLSGERSEDQFHDAVVDMLSYAFAGYPVVWTHFPAGGYKLTHAARARLSRLGLKAGFPDIMVWWKEREPRCLGIELKAAKGSLSAAQRNMHEQLWAVGVPVTICRNEEQVITWLRRNDVPMREISFGQTFNPGAAQGRTA